jgi:hypothetical protein
MRISKMKVHNVAISRAPPVRISVPIRAHGGQKKIGENMAASMK